MNDNVLRMEPDLLDAVKDKIITGVFLTAALPVNIGDLIILYFDDEYNQEFLFYIREHYQRKFSDINIVEASTCGYNHESILKHDLLTKYPELTNDTYLYYYCW